MFRRLTCGVLFAVVALAAGCKTTTTTITPTTSTTTTETFTGLLNPANTNVVSFSTQTGGTVKATLSSIGPDATQNVGFSLGTFNTGTNVCTIVYDNPAAAPSAVFTATASTAGNYCVRVYDNGSVRNAVAAGTATAFTYTVTVTHP